MIQRCVAPYSVGISWAGKFIPERSRAGRDGVVRMSFGYSLKYQRASGKKPSHRIPQRLQILILQRKSPYTLGCFGLESLALSADTHSMKHRSFRWFTYALVAVGLLRIAYADNDPIEKLKADAAKGSADAQLNLGEKYAKGQGVPKDAAEGAKWVRKAADQGDEGAQNYLGWMYAKGEGVPKDAIRAYVCFNLAALKLPEAAKARDDLEKTMTPAQIAEAQRLSREWKPSAPPKKPGKL